MAPGRSEPERTPPEPEATAAAEAPSTRLVSWLTDLVRVEIFLWDRVDARLQEQHELPLVFFESMYFISRAHSRSMRVGDLARAVRISTGGMSKLIGRIEEAGLVARSPDPDDRRAALVTLTPEGERAVRAAVVTYEQEVAAVVEPVLDRGEQNLMHLYVARLLAAAGPTER